MSDLSNFASPDRRIAVLLHEGIRGTHGKTGLALIRYRPEQIAVVIDYQTAGESFAQLTGIPWDGPIVTSVAEAIAYQPDWLAIGIAPSGGALPASWFQEIQQAVAAGCSIANGLHTPMAQHPDLTPLLQPGRTVWDMRQEPPGLSVGQGSARYLPCRRVLTVGTDMSIGKMSTSLQLDRACRARGLNSKFLGTGQAGMMISGEGIPLDAVRVDFASGAVEQLVVKFGNDHDILLIEGQGSLLHPASTATLPLMRGSQPTHLILVHRAGQTHIRTCPDTPIPLLQNVIELYESVAFAGGSFNSAKVVGIALNTVHLSDKEAKTEIDRIQQTTGLPCSDPIRYGVDVLIDTFL
ncbi:DUF1611 domain-containing protein [Alkalinema pantanalense CENA528]|uniref:DUF1611 domain-containing protein n=1 Tax=Alkalinema pantanalense TaxID=1620705 RepID=UPI003D7018A4